MRCGFFPSKVRQSTFRQHEVSFFPCLPMTDRPFFLLVSIPAPTTLLVKPASVDDLRMLVFVFGCIDSHQNMHVCAKNDPISTPIRPSPLSGVAATASASVSNKGVVGWCRCRSWSRTQHLWAVRPSSRPRVLCAPNSSSGCSLPLKRFENQDIQRPSRERCWEGARLSTARPQKTCANRTPR